MMRWRWQVSLVKAQRVASTRGVLPNKITCLEDFYTSPRVKHEQVLVTRHNEFCAAVQREREKFVVVSIGAVGDDAVRIDMLDYAVECGDHFVAMTLVVKVTQQMLPLDAGFEFSPSVNGDNQFEVLHRQIKALPGD